MSEFSNSQKWRLKNQFTIYEDRRLSDRPFMLTCVPKVVTATITKSQVIYHTALESEPNLDGQAYKESARIEFDAAISDRITVFSIRDGVVRPFRLLKNCQIHRSDSTRIGPYEYSSYEHHSYTGMSSRDVPDSGLMTGEDGRLRYIDDDEEEEEAYLTSWLYLEADTFDDLARLATYSNTSVKDISLHVLAELFESEMSASLHPGGIPREFGLLLNPTGTATTRARIESFTVTEQETIFPRQTTEDQNRATSQAGRTEDRLVTTDDGQPNGRRYSLVLLAAVMAACLAYLTVGHLIR